MTRLVPLRPATIFVSEQLAQVRLKRIQPSASSPSSEAVTALIGPPEVKTMTFSADAASGGRPQELLNEVMKLIGGALKDGHDSIRERVRQESPRWVPVGLRDAVADRLIGGVERLITEMLADPLHPMRKRFGPMWGYRWARERRVPFDGSREQEPPAWLQSYAETGVATKRP